MAIWNLTSVYKSLIAEIQDMISEIQNSGVSENMQYHAWDSRGDITELPDNDLMGLVDWTYAENGGLSVIDTGMMISTRNDKNLFKEVAILDIIRNHCVKEDGKYKTWDLKDENGDVYGQVQVGEFEVLPSGRSEVRNTRHIGIELRKTANYSDATT